MFQTYRELQEWECAKSDKYNLCERCIRMPLKRVPKTNPTQLMQACNKAQQPKAYERIPANRQPPCSPKLFALNHLHLFHNVLTSTGSTVVYKTDPLKIASFQKVE